MKILRNYLYAVLILFGSHSVAQNREIDSLNSLIMDAKADSVKVDMLIELSKKYYATDPSKAINIATEAKNQAIAINYQRGLAYALKSIGLVHYQQSRYKEAIPVWQEAQDVFEALGDKKGIANMLSNQGSAYFNEGGDTRALELYLQSLSIAEELGDSVRIVTILYSIGAVYANKPVTYDLALVYYQRALPIAINIHDSYGMGNSTVNIGEIYYKKYKELKRKDSLSTNTDYLSKALRYFEMSVKAFEEETPENLPFSYNYIGKVYAQRKEFEKAIGYQDQAFALAEKLDSKNDMAIVLIGLGETYAEKGDAKSALEKFHEAEKISKEINSLYMLKESYEGLTIAYKRIKDYGNAYKYSELLLGIKDTLFNLDTERKLGTLQFGYTLQKKEGEIKLQKSEISRQKLVRNGFIGGFAVVLLFAGIFFRQRNRISKEKKRSDELLLNILPEETAEELKATGTAKAKSFDQVTVLFTDFKNFTQASEILSAEELVEEINHCYSAFDRIVTRYGIEKIKTIGDAYMCAGGLPTSNTTHPEDVVRAGLEMQEFIANNKAERQAKGQPFFELRLGIHSGPVVAGIVGIKKFAYDIWGDTVNTASRMESSGEIGKVNISGTTFELVKDKFSCTHRGKVKAKNKGEIDMYFVEGPL